MFHAKHSFFTQCKQYEKLRLFYLKHIHMLHTNNNNYTIEILNNNTYMEI